MLPSEELVDVAARELFEETGLTLIVDDFTLFNHFNANLVRVSLPARQYQVVHVFSAYVLVLDESNTF
jgi:8-oxo-dGTP pyrophosphatase MutT (NUDIX family)